MGRCVVVHGAVLVFARQNRSGWQAGWQSSGDAFVKQCVNANCGVNKHSGTTESMNAEVMQDKGA